MGEVNKLGNYQTGMLDLYSLVKGYSDPRDKVPLAAVPKQALLNPEEGARYQGGGAGEFGQEDAKIEDQKLVRPQTFPLRPPYQHDYSFEEQWGSRKPQFPSTYEHSTSSKLRKAGSDLITPTPHLWMEDGYLNPTQNLNFQVGEQEDSQIYADQPYTLSDVSYRRGEAFVLQ